MSGIARLHLLVFLLVIGIGAVLWSSWPQSAAPVAYALASPYCATNSVSVHLEAKAAYAIDITSGKPIYEYNADAQLALASLTKMMTILVSRETLKPEDEVTISHEDLAPEGGGLKLGEVWRTADLTDYTLVASVNDGAHALAMAAADKKKESYDAFVASMNEKAKSLGLTQTFFANDTGLDLSTTAGGAYGSAKDVATLLGYVVKNQPRLFEYSPLPEATFKALSGEAHTVSNTSGFIGSLPGAIASKTGFTDLAGGNLAIAYEPILGHTVVAVVLGSTREGRDMDMKALTEAVKNWETRDILCTPSNNGH